MKAIGLLIIGAAALFIACGGGEKLTVEQWADRFCGTGALEAADLDAASTWGDYVDLMKKIDAYYADAQGSAPEELASWLSEVRKALQAATAFGEARDEDTPIIADAFTYGQALVAVLEAAAEQVEAEAGKLSRSTIRALEAAGCDPRGLDNIVETG